MNVMSFDMQFAVYPLIGLMPCVVNLVCCSLVVTRGLTDFSMERGHTDLCELYHTYQLQD